MPPRNTVPSVRSSDAAFRKQVAVTRDALRTFKTISGLKSPNLAQAALEELVTITVRHVFSFPASTSDAEAALAGLFQLSSVLHYGRLLQGALPSRLGHR